jgi:hypothetical protein
MLRYDLDWYGAHFAPEDWDEPKPVRGEISPEYARLKAWQVNRIAKLLPDLRLILTLRHPIERAWSQALLEFGYLGNRDVRKISSIDFLRQVERARNRLSSDYRRTIEIWSNALDDMLCALICLKRCKMIRKAMSTAFCGTSAPQRHGASRRSSPTRKFTQRPALFVSDGISQSL